MEANRGKWRPAEGNGGQWGQQRGMERPLQPMEWNGGQRGLSREKWGFLEACRDFCHSFQDWVSLLFFFTLPAVLILLLCAAVGIKAPVAYRRGSGTCPHLSPWLIGAPNTALSLSTNPLPLTKPQHWNCLMVCGDVVASWRQWDQRGKSSAERFC